MSNLLSSLSKTIHASLSFSNIIIFGLFYLNGGFAFDTFLELVIQIYSCDCCNYVDWFTLVF